MNDIQRLQKEIRDPHGCDSVHVQSTPVQESYEGKPVWEGVLSYSCCPIIRKLGDHMRGVMKPIRCVPPSNRAWGAANQLGGRCSKSNNSCCSTKTNTEGKNMGRLSYFHGLVQRLTVVDILRTVAAKLTNKSRNRKHGLRTESLF
jgi:hypothetical protein